MHDDGSVAGSLGTIESTIDSTQLLDALGYFGNNGEEVANREKESDEEVNNDDDDDKHHK